MAGVLLITYLFFSFTAPVMMPLHMAPFANQTEEVDDGVEMTAVLNQLIHQKICKIPRPHDVGGGSLNCIFS
jgi:hypothetical protein